jgi:hypothetical protein
MARSSHEAVFAMVPPKYAHKGMLWWRVAGRLLPLFFFFFFSKVARSRSPAAAIKKTAMLLLSKPRCG